MRDVNIHYAQSVKNFTYAVKKTKYKINGVFRSKKYIALVDKRTNLIVLITDFADYLIYLKTIDMSFDASNDAGLYAVCQFLNFALIENYEKYKIKSIEEISIKIFRDFLCWYANTPTKQGNYPQKKSVISKRDNISIFLAMLCHYKGKAMKYITKEDVIGTNYILTPDYQTVKAIDYKVKVRYREHGRRSNQLLRDMPLEIVERFIKMSQIYDPELTFAIVLMAYAGLREGEICNVRRKESCFGPGIIITYGDGFDPKDVTYKRCNFCDAIELDLRDTLALRSDGKEVGEIKRERMQAVYAGFVDVIAKYYEKHIFLIKEKACEDTRPMFLNKNRDLKTGKYMAITKAALQNRINNLFQKHVLPSLEKDANPKLKMFYAQMQNHSWGAHAFRHWFTVCMVLLGCDEVVIQSARGDRNRNSSKAYLERKGELQNIYSSSLEVLGRKIRSDI